MAFSYALDNDAFKDIEDLRLRNQRIQQDILNQKRNNARIAAAQQFAMWQSNPNAFGGDIPTSDFYALGAYGKPAPFAGAPSVSQAMTGLKESGGLALPKRKALYRTDENGNPVRLTDEELAIRNNASKDLQKQAASDAATPANVGSWYDFLKNPQNTPYEQKQMRNHEILRDAAIGSMLMKPIFNPDTDISEGMMAVGRKKVESAGLSDIISFAREDCFKMSFPDGRFDAVTAAFGIRNFSDLDGGLREMCRVLKPGGHLCVVELTTPVRFPMRQLFWIYSHTILPLYGKLISKDKSAYRYLTATIEAFPQGERMVEILKGAGFSDARFRRLTFGICTLYLATK